MRSKNCGLASLGWKPVVPPNGNFQVSQGVVHEPG